MLVGVPKEIKDNEFRVGLMPVVGRRAGASRPRGAGRGGRRRRRRALTDEEYMRGRRDASSPAADEIFARSRDGREGQGAARGRAQEAAARPDPVHLSPSRARSPSRRRTSWPRGATCIAYETVTSPIGALPLLTPMSEVAGRLAPQVGAHCLEKAQGGRGVLLGGVPGVPAARGGGARRRRLGHACRDHRGRHGRQRHRGRPLGRGAASASPRSSAPAMRDRSSRPASR